MSGTVESVDTDEAVELVIQRVRQAYGRWGRHTPVSQRRADWDALFGADDIPACITPVDVAGLAAEWVEAPGTAARGVLLYLHGGGFQVGSTYSHRELMAGLSATSGCRVLGLNYRLAPEHAFPAQQEDCMKAWHWLRSQGLRANQLAIAGDSAGGGLALGLLLALRDAGQPQPAAAVTLSAWTDLSAQGESYETRAAADPIHQRSMIQFMARQVLGDADPCDLRVSPLHASLHGLAPLLMQVGDRETVLSDSTRFAERARAAGVAVELQVWPGMIHVFQQFPRELQAARLARELIGAFLRRHLAHPSI